jgi:hypothetical protein
MTFKQFLIEKNQHFKKLIHLDHVEDHVFSGKEGHDHAVSLLHGVHDRLSGNATTTKVTTKFDGSPSVVFGSHPKTGKFFVGTKAALSQNPTICHSVADVVKHYGNKPDLAQKLITALRQLPKVAPQRGVYQGDIMYTNDSKHEDRHQYHFTPNTLMYSVDKDSEDGKKIKDAHLGIVVHTKYHGKDLEDMAAGFEPDIQNFGKSKHVHMVDPEIHLESKAADTDTTNTFQRHMKDAEMEALKAHPEMFEDTAVHSSHLKKYINETVRSGEKPTPMGFKASLAAGYQREAAKLKTPAGKLRKKEELISHTSHIDEHHEKYNSLLNIHHHLSQAKLALLQALDKTGRFETSMDGEEVPGEGFVAIHKGHPSKLVDRSGFSKANFEKHKKPAA